MKKSLSLLALVLLVGFTVGCGGPPPATHEEAQEMLDPAAMEAAAAIPEDATSDAAPQAAPEEAKAE